MDSNNSLNTLTLKHSLVQAYVNSHNIKDLYLAIAHFIEYGAINESDRLETLRNLIDELMRRTEELSNSEILDAGKFIHKCLGIELSTINDHRTWINNLVTLQMKKDNDGSDLPSEDLLFNCWYKVSESIKLQSETENYASASYLGIAIQCLKSTVTLAAVGTANYTKANRMLGACLLARYKRNGIYGNPDDFNEGTRCSMTYERKPNEKLHRLAKKLQKLYNEQFNEKELKDDIEKYRELLTANSDSQSDSALVDVYLNLGTALSSLFNISGDIAQLNEAIMHLDKAVELAPDDGVVNLALALASIQKVRLIEYWEPERFIKVKQLINKAMSLLPLNIGGITEIILGFSNTYSLEEIALRMHSMVPVTKDPFDKAVLLAQRRYSFYLVTGDSKILDDCIAYTREAIELCPDNYSKTYVLYHDLAEAQFARYQCNKHVEDLDDSIQSYDICLEILPQSHYLRAEYLIKLATAKEHKHQLKYREGISPSESYDMAVAYMQLYRAAGWEAASSPVMLRAAAAIKCAKVMEGVDRDRASKAYDKVLYFLPRLSLLGKSVEHRYQDIFRKLKTDGISRKAALNAIILGNFQKAIESLEAGRAVFWQQALNLRVPTDSLRKANPKLEERFSKICAELSRYNMNDDNMIHHLGTLNKNMEDTLDEIHKLEGFTDFLMPQKLGKLQNSLAYPIVYLIPDDNGSHALILLPNDVKYVSLPDAPYHELLRNVQLLPVSFKSTENPSTFPERSVIWDNLIPKSNARHGRVVSSANISPLKDVLNFLWKYVVSRIATALELTKDSGHRTRLMWCPTGIFSFLPLHAAGIYNDDMSSGSCTFDYFISSYTSTAAAITSTPAVKSLKPFKMMVIIDPNDLPYSIDEMHNIEKHISSEDLLKFGTENSPALVETVASKMSEASIVHFACHGTQIVDKPFNSYLKLLDGGLTISRIMEQHMPNATLAFLCACESAMGDQALPDEAIHLGASLLFSGFKSVVGTMWSIFDNDGPVFADTVYAHLMKDNATVPNTELTAEAVHLATLELRKQGVDFKRWVPFIHIGN